MKFEIVQSYTEENYLKAVYKLQESNGDLVSTNAVAQAMGVHAPSVTDMLKRLAGKKLVIYQKSKGFKLTEKGKLLAVQIISWALAGMRYTTLRNSLNIFTTNSW